MRKILLLIIIVLLLTFGYISLVNGLAIGPLQILSMKQIEEESQKLKAKIEEANMQIDVEYPNKVSQLKTASDNMKQAEEEYLKYTNLSSDEEILEARTEKSYAIEFLWAKLGSHARKEGINLKLEIVSSITGANNVNDLKFTVEGSYIAITNFIYAIENDTDLDFRIQNFKLLPYKEEILQGTFTVVNIGIQGNTLNEEATTQNNEQSNNVNNEKQTNNTTTETKSNDTNTVII